VDGRGILARDRGATRDADRSYPGRLLVRELPRRHVAISGRPAAPPVGRVEPFSLIPRSSGAPSGIMRLLFGRGHTDEIVARRPSGR
jgi:hypothetical protein